MQPGLEDPFQHQYTSGGTNGTQSLVVLDDFSNWIDLNCSRQSANQRFPESEQAEDAYRLIE